MAIASKRTSKIVAWAGAVALAAAAAVVAFRGDWVSATLLAAFLLGVLLLLTTNVGLPPVIDGLFVVAAVVNAAGWVWDLYDRVPGFDEVAHFYTSFAITAALGYAVFHGMNDCFRENGWRYVLVITCFGITIGTLWEIAEWMFIENLADPITDIILDSAGSLLAAIISLRFLRGEELLED